MTKTILFLFMIAGSLNVQAQTIKSDCAPAETQVLANPTFFNQVAQGKLMSSDCTAGPDNKLFSVMTINVPTGVESYLVVTERKGLTVASKPLFVSLPLGFDAFPMMVNKAQRLLFIKNEAGKPYAIYLNIQTGPNASRLGRWELDLEKKKLIENQQRFWMMNAGRLPKIFEEKGQWRANIDGKTVTL